MPLSEQDLALLRCPVTRSALRYADADLIARLNLGIAAGTVLTRLSAVVTEPLDAALINADDSLIHRCDAGIITLLASEAIEIWEYSEES
ncbi:MAG TPA: hypothetical protein VL096_19625 [Pirellulaceae bacterium]|nr:hypothetical protein [Pirellulaceae bacterium]